MTFHRRWGILSLLAALSISPALAEQCLSPTVTHDSYTSSSEASAARETVFIVTFDLTCKNEAAPRPNVYAALVSGEGKTLSAVKPAAKTGVGYQISFSGEHAELPKGAYIVRLYDEDGFAALKKAQRQEGGEDAAEAAVDPLSQLTLLHNGVWKEELIRGEALALALAFVAFYVAHSAKSRIQEH